MKIGSPLPASRSSLTAAERRLLELAASSSLQGALHDWPGLRALFRRLGAPARPGYTAPLMRAIAMELLIELGLRPRPDCPLVCITLPVFLRTFRRAHR